MVEFFDLSGVMELIADRAHHIVGARGAGVEFAEGDDMVSRAVTGIASSMLGVRIKLECSLSRQKVATPRAGVGDIKKLQVAAQT